MARQRTHLKKNTGSRGSKAMRQSERRRSRPASKARPAMAAEQAAAEPAGAVAQEPQQPFPSDVEENDAPLPSEEIRETFDEANALGMGTEEPSGRLAGDAPEDPTGPAVSVPETGTVPNPAAQDDSFSGWVPYDPDLSTPEEIGEDMGVAIEPDEPLDLAGKLENRDRNRWELNPASSEDYEERIKGEKQDTEENEELE